jgi:hypothetical protein
MSIRRDRAPRVNLRRRTLVLLAADAPFAAALDAVPAEESGLVQDLGGWRDDNAEKDLEESQRDSGHNEHACRCPLEQELLGRLPQWHIS